MPTNARTPLFALAPVALAASLFLQTVGAQAATPPTADASADQTQSVVVTGTRRSNRTVAESESPVDVLSARDLQASGAPDLGTVLSQLLPSFNDPRPSVTDASDAVRAAQLRGLAPDETLVLVDGKRRHTTSVVNVNGSQGRGSAPVDLSSIPIAAIDHIEVLRDGAAAQYGSDAIAGVINIILKKGAQGGFAQLEGGQTSRHDGGLLAGSASAGYAFDPTGWLRLSVEERKQDHTNRAGHDTRDPTEPRYGQVNQRYGDPDSRQQSITDLAFSDGRLYIAGLSNEEFASKLRSVKYPFAAADNGASVEIFHGNHGQLETRSPVYTFIPYTIDSKPYVIASYTCTPLVRFSMDSLKGSKVVGTTIAELGAGNRPLDMILYKKDGKEFLLMSNNSRGVMKIPTAAFGSATPITEPVKSETAGISYEKITSMTGVEQMDLLDAQRSIVLARTTGGLNLSAVPLP